MAAVAFIFSDGVLNGQILLHPRGNNGFGYDPIFDVNGITLAEMTLKEKSNINFLVNIKILRYI